MAVKHVVLLKFKKTTTPERIKEIFAALANLRNYCQGLLDFSGGAYSGPENMGRGYTHGFVMTFRDAGCRDMYLPSEAHQGVVKWMMPDLEGGKDGVLAFDWEYDPSK